MKRPEIEKCDFCNTEEEMHIENKYKYFVYGIQN